MKYKEYPGYTKPYIVVHNTGFGVQEARYIEHDVMFQADTWEEAVNKANELKQQNNTKEEIESSWCNNTYHININILSSKGKALLEEFNKNFEELLILTKQNLGYREIKLDDGSTVSWIKHPLFDK